MKVKMIVFTPLTPNFIRTSLGNMSIAHLEDAALRTIGKDWTKALIEKARKKRKAKQP